MPVPDTPYQTRARTRSGMLLLDRNEGPGAVSADALAFRDEPHLFNRYPDPAPLEAAIAERFGLSPDRVIVTAGADDAIDRTCRAYLETRPVLLTHQPTFEMLARYATLAGATPRSVAWTRGPFPVSDLLEQYDMSVGLVALVSPNNPTGLALDEDALGRIASAVAPTPLLLDFAYIEYADEDLTELALSFDHVVVARTFSKAWGLAGCRVGYALGSPDMIRVLRSAGAPYPVSGPSLRIATTVLEQNAPSVADHVARVKTHRTELSRALNASGARVLPSQANFVLAEFGAPAPFVRDGLAALNVLVRDFTRLTELDGALRISVPMGSADLAVALRALATIREPQAILFDLDGVMVDVRDSYRRCIRDTAAVFGVDVTEADVERIKGEGNANNDWDVTHRLLERRGVAVSLDQVTDEFQRRYLGEESDGLVLRERAIMSLVALERIADRYPVAVVTGRPRSEAQQALERFGYDRFIRHVVTMEDAPAKPHPEPVRVALRALGKERAWMLGDSPDDVVAARSAGVLPIGVATVDTSATTRDALVASGPAIILTSPDDLERSLPS